MLTKLDIPPGVYRNGTKYQAGNRWYDVNLVRWIDGTMMPVGGWQKFSTSAITGVCRGLFAWRDNQARKWLAIGTHSRLYVHDGGALVNITPSGFVAGENSSVPGLGFGAGVYGAGTYGTPRSGTGITLEASTWSFDSWGENLVACATSDGKIYQWALSTITPAAVVANAPTNNLGCFVTDQRHLVALGAGGDSRTVSWSDAEDNTDWTPTSLNQAGDFQLNTPGHIRTAVKTRGETLILTSTDCHAMRFIGSPLVFSFDRVGTNCGVAGPNAAVPIEGGVAWFGNDAKIYAYNGAVQAVPCDVEDWLEDEFEKTKQAEVYGGALSEHGEVWWYFLAKDGQTKYVVWNTRYSTWSIGVLDRTAWLDRGVWSYPVAVSSDGYLYQHETGTDDSGATRVGSVYAESGFGDINLGDRVLDVLQILPDEKSQGDVSVTIKCRYTPTGAETSYGPYIVRSDGYTDVRASGRQMALRIDALSDADWRVGTFRADVKAGGQR